MVTLDWHLLLVQALSFLITLWVLKRWAWGPIQGMLAGRETEIRTDYEKADAARREMEDMRRQYQQRIEQADAEARARINASTQRAEQLKDEILAKAQQDAAALAERSRSEIERERQKVLAELRSQVT
ncbi:MAG: F0F1 ATP synthase subunit B, partial [Chloroflexi bacterium]|nr:F0F1 ATP synthase subunit B [Chloroflexota bacterium]